MTDKQQELEGKIYQGDRNLRFRKCKEPFDEGGNGKVYYVSIIGQEELPAVAKFFSCKNEKSLRERYRRFYKEIAFMKREIDLDGILPILDSFCPEKMPEDGTEVWFLMPKAKRFEVIRNEPLEYKLQQMLRLALIIQSLHEKGYAHRDIKPENILFYEKKLYLSDYGLVWNIGDERITQDGERVGPYRILPPELDPVEPARKDIYQKSDVYLFAKVLWMYLKRDNLGFRGPYQRGADQIYLDKGKLQANTLEPLHRLMADATYDNPEQRIGIGECIDLLELQIEVLQDDPEMRERIQKLSYEERIQETRLRRQPTQLVYTDEEDIAEMVRSAAEFGCIRILSGGIVVQESDKTRITMLDANVFEVDAKVAENLTRKFRCHVESVSYNTKNHAVTVKLGDIEEEQKQKDGLISLKESLQIMYRGRYDVVICLGRSEEIVLCSVNNQS